MMSRATDQSFVRIVLMSDFLRDSTDPSLSTWCWENARRRRSCSMTCRTPVKEDRKNHHHGENEKSIYTGQTYFSKPWLSFLFSMPSTMTSRHPGWWLQNGESSISPYTWLPAKPCSPFESLQSLTCVCSVFLRKNPKHMWHGRKSDTLWGSAGCLTTTSSPLPSAMTFQNASQLVGIGITHVLKHAGISVCLPWCCVHNSPASGACKACHPLSFCPLHLVYR